MVKIQELIYSERKHHDRVMGYRISVKGRLFDFSTELLDYVFESYLKYGVSLKLELKPLALSIEGDCYVVPHNDFATELVDEQDVDYELGYLLARCTKDEVNIQHLLYYRYLVCKEKLLGIDIVLGDIIEVSASAKMTRAWGNCARYRNRTTGQYSFRVSISDKLLFGTEEYEGIDNTIIHELLHTCHNCFNHGDYWKGAAQYVCEELGYDIKRLSSAEEKGFDPETLISMGYYACQCVSCGKILTYKTECQFIKHPEYYLCGCGGAFTRIN